MGVNNPKVINEVQRRIALQTAERMVEQTNKQWHEAIDHLEKARKEVERYRKLHEDAKREHLNLLKSEVAKVK